MFLLLTFHAYDRSRNGQVRRSLKIGLKIYPNGHFDAECATQLFINGLPFKLKEHILLDRAWVSCTIVELEQETARQVKTITI